MSFPRQDSPAKRTRSTARDRRGFTLVEMVVALVLGAIVAAILLEVLLAQLRLARLLGAREAAVHDARGVTELIGSELRAVPIGGIVAADSASVTFRKPRAWGVLCSHSTGAAAVLFPSAVAGAVRQGESFLALPLPDTAGGWRGVAVTDAGSPGGGAGGAACADLDPVPLPEGEIRRLRVFTPAEEDGTLGIGGDGETLAPGTPVFVFDPVRYATGTSDGRRWIRRNTGPAMLMQPLAGPLPQAGGLRFRYFDAAAEEIEASGATIDLARIRRVEVSVVTEVRTRGGATMAAESASVRVTLRSP